MSQPGYDLNKPGTPPVPPAPNAGQPTAPPPAAGYPAPQQGAPYPQGQPAPYPPQGQPAPYPGQAPAPYPPQGQAPFAAPAPYPVPAGGGGNPMRAAAMKKGLIQLAIGVGLIVLGIVISLATYAFAPGGSYFIVWGLPLFGVITIVRGLITMVRGR